MALEERAMAWRETQTAVALGVCGSTRRRGGSWFAAKRGPLISPAAAGSRARAQYRQGGNQPVDLKVPKAAQKAPKKGMKAGKLAFTEATPDGVGNGGVGAYWEAVRALNSVGRRAGDQASGRAAVF